MIAKVDIVAACAPVPSFLPRVIVDPLMLERLKLLSSPAPRDKEPYVTPHYLAGIPIYLEPDLGDERGVILHADGRIEKFGKWPSLASEAAP